MSGMSCVWVKWWLRLGLHVFALEIPRKPAQDVPAWSVVVSTTLACQAGYDLVSGCDRSRGQYMIGSLFSVSVGSYLWWLWYNSNYCSLWVFFKTWTYSHIFIYLQSASNRTFSSLQYLLVALDISVLVAIYSCQGTDFKHQQIGRLDATPRICRIQRKAWLQM